MEEESGVKGPVLVTGASGYIGTWLVMKLLNAGYTVRATVLDLDNSEETKPLLDLPGSSERLTISQADMREKGSYVEVIKGSTGVFHLATPMDFNSKDPENEIIKPTVDGLIDILRASKNSGTVKRVVFTSSAAAVDIEENKKPVYDEECWSDVDYIRRVKMTGWMYFLSKTLAEQAAWKYAEENNIDLITVMPTLVVGPFLSSGMPPSLITALSLITGTESHYSIIKQGNFIHLDDLCAAQIFLFEKPEAKGRYICSAYHNTIFDLAKMLKNQYPEFEIPQKFEGIDENIMPVCLSSKKLLELGFIFQYKIEEMFDGAIRTCKERKLIPLETRKINV
ncbi:hypothetical protein LUZ60_012736 [Juncus effusus]|nr:hypothetical protein LUZ60_012736 [Juncus effusus]